MNETINQTLQSVVDTSAGTLFGHSLPLTSSPTWDIFILTLFTSLFITLVNKFFSDQVAIKALRKEMKTLQKEMRKVMAKDPKKAQTMQQQIMKKNMENMKYAFNLKVMMITMVPMMFMFIAVRQLYTPFGEFFNLLGFTTFGWLGTYILFSMINSIIMKKFLDVA